MRLCGGRAWGQVHSKSRPSARPVTSIQWPHWRLTGPAQRLPTALRASVQSSSRPASERGRGAYDPEKHLQALLDNWDKTKNTAESADAIRYFTDRAAHNEFKFRQSEDAEELLACLEDVVNTGLDRAANLAPTELKDTLQAAKYLFVDLLRGQIEQWARAARSHSDRASVDRCRKLESLVLGTLLQLLSASVSSALAAQSSAWDVLTCVRCVDELRLQVPAAVRLAFAKQLHSALSSRGAARGFTAKCSAEQLMSAVAILQPQVMRDSRETKAKQRVITEAAVKQLQAAADRLGWGQASDLSKDNNRILPEPPADLRTDGSTGSASKGSPTATGLSTSDVVTLALFYLSLPLETIEGMETWALHLVAAAVAKPGDKDADAGTWLPMATTLLAPSPLLAMQPPAIQLAYMTGVCSTVETWCRREKHTDVLLGHPQARGLVLALKGFQLPPDTRLTTQDELSIRGYLQSLVIHVTNVSASRLHAKRGDSTQTALERAMMLEIFSTLQDMYTPGAKDNTLPGTINKLVKGCTEDMVRYFVNNKGLKAGGKPGRLIRALTLPELVAWQYLTLALGVPVSPNLQGMWEDWFVDQQTTKPDKDWPFEQVSALQAGQAYKLLVQLVKAGRTPTNSKLLDLSLPMFADIVGMSGAPGFAGDYGVLVASLANTDWIARSPMRDTLAAAGYALVAQGKCPDAQVLTDLVQALGNLAMLPAVDLPDKLPRVTGVSYDTYGSLKLPTPQDWATTVSTLLEQPTYSQSLAGLAADKRVQLLYSLTLHLKAVLPDKTILAVAPPVRAQAASVCLSQCSVDALVQLMELVRAWQAAPAAGGWPAALVIACNQAFTDAKTLPAAGVLMATTLHCLPTLASPALRLLAGSGGSAGAETADKERAATDTDTEAQLAAAAAEAQKAAEEAAAEAQQAAVAATAAEAERVAAQAAQEEAKEKRAAADLALAEAREAAEAVKTCAAAATAAAARAMVLQAEANAALSTAAAATGGLKAIARAALHARKEATDAEEAAIEAAVAAADFEEAASYAWSAAKEAEEAVAEADEAEEAAAAAAAVVAEADSAPAAATAEHANNATSPSGLPTPAGPPAAAAAPAAAIQPPVAQAEPELEEPTMSESLPKAVKLLAALLRSKLVTSYSLQSLQEQPLLLLQVPDTLTTLDVLLSDLQGLGRMPDGWLQGYIGFTQGYLAELGSEHPVSLIQAMWAVQQLGQAEGYVPPELWVRDATRPLLQQLQALQKSHAPMVCILLASLHRYLVSTTPPSDSSQPVNPYADTAAAGAYGQELCQAALQAATLWAREDLSNTMHAETDPSVLQTSLQALVALQQAGRPNLVPKPAWFVLCCNALTQAVSQPRYANTGFVLTATQSLLALQRMRDEYKPQQSIVRFVNTDAHTKLLLPRDQAVQVQPSSKGAATGISYETLSELLTGFMSGRIAMPSRLVNALLKKSKSQGFLAYISEMARLSQGTWKPQLEQYLTALSLVDGQADMTKEEVLSVLQGIETAARALSTFGRVRVPSATVASLCMYFQALPSDTLQGISAGQVFVRCCDALASLPVASEASSEQTVSDKLLAELRSQITTALRTVFAAPAVSTAPTDSVAYLAALSLHMRLFPPSSTSADVPWPLTDAASWQVVMPSVLASAGAGGKERGSATKRLKGVTEELSEVLQTHAQRSSHSPSLTPPSVEWVAQYIAAVNITVPGPLDEDFESVEVPVQVLGTLNALGALTLPRLKDMHTYVIPQLVTTAAARQPAAASAAAIAATAPAASSGPAQGQKGQGKGKKGKEGKKGGKKQKGGGKPAAQVVASGPASAVADVPTTGLQALSTLAFNIIEELSLEDDLDQEFSKLLTLLVPRMIRAEQGENVVAISETPMGKRLPELRLTNIPWSYEKYNSLLFLSATSGDMPEAEAQEILLSMAYLQRIFPYWSPLDDLYEYYEDMHREDDSSEDSDTTSTEHSSGPVGASAASGEASGVAGNPSSSGPQSIPTPVGAHTGDIDLTYQDPAAPSKTSDTRLPTAISPSDAKYLVPPLAASDTVVPGHTDEATDSNDDESDEETDSDEYDSEIDELVQQRWEEWSTKAVALAEGALLAGGLSLSESECLLGFVTSHKGLNKPLSVGLVKALLPRVVRRDMLTAVPRTQLLLRVLTAVHDAPWTDDQWREIEGCLTDEQVTELCRALTTLTGNLRGLDDTSNQMLLCMSFSLLFKSPDVWDTHKPWTWGSARDDREAYSKLFSVVKSLITTFMRGGWERTMQPWNEGEFAKFVMQMRMLYLLNAVDNMTNRPARFQSYGDVAALINHVACSLQTGLTLVRLVTAGERAAVIASLCLRARVLEFATTGDEDVWLNQQTFCGPTLLALNHLGDKMPTRDFFMGLEFVAAAQVVSPIMYLAAFMHLKPASPHVPLLHAPSSVKRVREEVRRQFDIMELDKRGEMEALQSTGLWRLGSENGTALVDTGLHKIAHEQGRAAAGVAVQPAKGTDMVPIPGEDTGTILRSLDQHTPQLIMQHSHIWALVGGGPYIASKYDKAWRYAILYSMSQSELFYRLAKKRLRKDLDQNLEELNSRVEGGPVTMNEGGSEKSEEPKKSEVEERQSEGDQAESVSGSEGGMKRVTFEEVEADEALKRYQDTWFRVGTLWLDELKALPSGSVPVPVVLNLISIWRPTGVLWSGVGRVVEKTNEPVITKELFRIADWSSLRRDGLETRQLIQLQAIFLVWPEFHSEFVTAYRRGGLLEAGRSLMSRVGRMFGGKGAQDTESDTAQDQDPLIHPSDTLTLPSLLHYWGALIDAVPHDDLMRAAKADLNQSGVHPGIRAFVNMNQTPPPYILAHFVSRLQERQAELGRPPLYALSRSDIQDIVRERVEERLKALAAGSPGVGTRGDMMGSLLEMMRGKIEISTSNRRRDKKGFR